MARRLEGHALLAAIRYEVEKRRCSAGGEVCTATLPDAAGEEQESPRARAVLAVRRSSVGVPFSRLDGSQAMLGGPVPDATQGDQIARGADGGYGVVTHLEGRAAQGELIYPDDTPVRILSRLAANRHAQARAEARGVSRATARTGMSTTAVVGRSGAQTMCLDDSGRAHAGEHREALLTKREADHGQPLGMSEALTRQEADETVLMRCHWLAHGRRKCSELEDVFPAECTVVIDALQQVFDPDDQAEEQQRSAQERFTYHQASSGPLMEGLKRWLEPQCAARLVEPQSSLGTALSSLLGHWETLTRFSTAA